jgi:uncharacterized DUF497 family protein
MTEWTEMKIIDVRAHVLEAPPKSSWIPMYWNFDDLDASGEVRFNAIGLVDGRMLFVTYAMRGEVVRIISARGAEPNEKRKYHEI